MQVVDVLGVSYTHYAKIEEGMRGMSLKMLIKLIRYFETDANTILGSAAMWYYNAIYEPSSVLDITSGGNKPLYALSRCYDKLSETSEDIEQIAQFRQMAEDYKYQAEQWKLPDEIV